jgi:DNA polymerase-3 subunit beta
MENARSVELPAEDLLRALRSVEYAQSSDEHRHVLNGVYCQWDSDTLSLVATDGRRLALAVLPGGQGSGSPILPAGTVTELLRLLGAAEQVQISLTERQMAFDVGYGEGGEDALRSIYLVSKVVEGNYPAYRQVIPPALERRVTLSREAFLGALQRASLVCDGVHPAVLLKFRENLLEISASSSEFGEALERLGIAFPGPDEAHIAFNPRYLIEPLRALNSPEISFEFRDQMGPGVLRDGDHFLCVVMPLRDGVV